MKMFGNPGYSRLSPLTLAASWGLVLLMLAWLGWRDYQNHLQQQQSQARQAVNAAAQSAKDYFKDAARQMQQLLEQEQQLEVLRQAAEDAMRNRDAYLKAGTGMLEMLQDIEDLKAKARYYEHLGARMIYLTYMEELAKLEERYDRLRQERLRRIRAVRDDLDEVDLLEREVERQLQRIPKLMKADENMNYQGYLHQRFATFNLRHALDRWFTGRA